MSRATNHRRRKMNITLPENVMRIISAISDKGGKALLVGGMVRDAFLGGVKSKDIDLEIFGLTLKELEAILNKFGVVDQVGASFGVLMVKGLNIDFSLPRRDSKTGAGHRGFIVEVDPNISFSDAALRRDLTINSMSWNPLTQELIDCHNGLKDLKAGVLKATDPKTFIEDPLRALRVAQFAARFNFTVSQDLVNLCSTLDLSELPAERLLEEFNKLLMKGKTPSVGLEFLLNSKLIRFFPELQALIGVPQDPKWHPEGDVWIHTLMVVDEASKLRIGDETEDLILMYSALCHDLGKPETTEEINNKITSRNHESAGGVHTQNLLNNLKAPKDLIEKVSVLVEHHLKPAMLGREGTSKASPAAYRRLARKLGKVGVNLILLERLARADCWGRTTEEAINKTFKAGDNFLKEARELSIEKRPANDIVNGKHLIEKGLKPGPIFTTILNKCREIQYEGGETNHEVILNKVLN